jgi:low affinity Fe/Cu permease
MGPPLPARAFGSLARATVEATGSPWAFATAVGVVLCWSVAGPLFGFSAGWQLFINTTTTVATFLMVFLIQHAQNRDTKAVHAKLNEVVAALSGADNGLIAAERLDDAQLADLGRRFEELGRRLQRRGRTRSSASVATVPPSVLVEERVMREEVLPGTRRVVHRKTLGARAAARPTRRKRAKAPAR